MSNIPSRGILESISGYTQSDSGSKQSADRPVKIATVEPYYTSGLVRVQFDGETTLSGKGYTWSNNYLPRGGDRVYLVPVGQSYIIAGKLSSNVSIPISYDIPMSGSWRPYDAGTTYYPPQVTRTATGLVSLRGLATGSTVTAGTVIGVLPEPFRPLVRQSFPVMMNNAAAGLDVDPSGELILGFNAGNGSYLSLDNITFNNSSDVAWYDHLLTNSWTNVSSDLVAQYAHDAIGRVWMRGGVTRTSAPSANSFVTTTTNSLKPQYDMHMPNYGASRFSYFDIVATHGAVRWKTGSGSPAWWYIDSAMYTPTGVGSYTNLSMINGWVNNSATHTPCSFWKDPEGIVHLRGLVRGGTSVIATLPEGARPAKTVLRGTVSADASARIDIYADGRIAPSLGSNSWYSLDGIDFVAEQ